MADEKKPQLKYYHFRSSTGKGSVSIGYTVDLEKKVVQYVVAKCASHDNFCRRIGRDICEGRFIRHGVPRQDGSVRDFVKTHKYENYSEIKSYFVDTYHPDKIVVVTGTPVAWGKSPAKPPVPFVTQPYESDTGLVY